MKFFSLMLLSNLTSLMFAYGAVWLAMNEKSGSGWCIIAALLTHTVYESKTKKYD